MAHLRPVTPALPSHIRDWARTSNSRITQALNPRHAFPRVPGCCPLSSWLCQPLAPPQGLGCVLGRVRRRDAPGRGTAPPTRGWRPPRRRELAAAEARAAGPVRGRRAPRSSLARLLCSYLDSAARAQEFPVMPPVAPSVARSPEGGGRLGQRRRLAGLSMSARRTLPRPLSLGLCLCLCLVAARDTAHPGKLGSGSAPPRPFFPPPGPS